MDVRVDSKITMTDRRPAAVWLLVIFLAVHAHIATARPLVVGTIGGAPSEQIERFAPLAADLAAPLRSDAIDGGRVVVADGVWEMAEWLREARVDVYIDSPLAALAVSDLAASQMTLRCAGEGTGDSHSILFSLKTSGIGSPAELGGQTIAFASPHSTFGYLLPKLTLGSLGVALRRPGEDSAAGRDKAVSYVFSGDDETTLVWVLRGKVDAGAVAEEAYRRQGKRGAERLQVIGETPALPAWIVSLRGTLPNGLLSRLTAHLGGMGDREDGRRALRDGAGFERCDLVSEQDLAAIIRARPFVRAHFGIP